MSEKEKTEKTEEQLVAEETANGADVYVHTFKKPFEWEGVTYDKLTFDFGGLTAMDMEDIDDELAVDNRYAIMPEYSAAYVLRLAAKAAKVHISLIEHLPIFEGNIIRRKARAFFMRGE
jgi:hypothetical protein